MVQELFDKNIFSYIMLALCAGGIILKLILNLVYSRLIKASDNMAISKNKLTQMMKKKFETCYKLKIGVNNVDIFVDKYVFRHRFCGILLSTWENIGGQILMLCLLIGSISTIIGLIYECGKQQILGTFSVGILTSGLLIFLEGLINISGRKELIRLNMKDYLENILKVRLEQEQFQPELIEQYKKEYFHEEAVQAMNTAELLAATNEKSGKLARKAKRDKLTNLKSEKIRQKKQQRAAVRIDKENRKAEAKAAVLSKREDKRMAIEKKKMDKVQSRLKAHEEEERIKKETKLALERKREAERAEIERIRSEVKANEELKKEEKRRQEEIKKALLLEKKVIKEEKHKPQPVEYKTIAQERKENLKREVRERRNLESHDEEKEVEVNNIQEDKIAITIMDEKTAVDSQVVQKPVAEKIKPEKYQPQKAVIETPRVEKAQTLKTSAAPEDKVKPVNNRKSKQAATADEKLIEDILKEFLA